MNERIKEFAEQAGCSIDGMGYGEGNIEGLAELIVQKCAGIIEAQDVSPAFKLRMSWAVKKYFGVEE